jgi:hypothetical protein
VVSLIGIDVNDVLAVLTPGIWDRDWYLEQYADVAESGEDPLLHYLVCGWRELRSPGGGFDARWYSAQYGVDVVKDHPAVHFVKEGRAAGLRPRADAHPSDGVALDVVSGR